MLLDLTLPDMGGLDVLSRLRRMPGCAALPVIVLTGSAGDSALPRAFESGASDYMRKPFHGPELRARIQTALRTQSLVQSLQEQAMRDPLTGLLNREALLRQLDAALRRDSGEGQTNGAVLYLDFDRFKLLNDVYGHEAGDELLRQIAARLGKVAATEVRGAEHRHAGSAGPDGWR